MHRRRLGSYFQYCKRDGITPLKVPVADLYYGPSYDDQQVEAALKETGWIKKAQYHKDINSLVGDILAQGKIIARFNGNDVNGNHRALGNRSILPMLGNLKMVNRINSAIKHRDFWMPFAAKILEDQMSEYL